LVVNYYSVNPALGGDASGHLILRNPNILKLLRITGTNMCVGRKLSSYKKSYIADA